MIEDDGKVDLVRPEGDAERYGEGLLYDLGKFLTTLSLLAIGGVLTIAESSRLSIKPVAIGMIAVILASAAVLAASTSSTIAYARYTGKPVKSNLPRMMQATMALLGMGLGSFMYIWIAKLN